MAVIKVNSNFCEVVYFIGKNLVVSGRVIHEVLPWFGIDGSRNRLVTK